MNRTPGNEHSNPIARAFSKFFERGKVGRAAADDTPTPASRGASRPQTKSAITPSQHDATVGAPRTGTTPPPTAPRASKGRAQGATATSSPSAAATTPTATAAPRTYTVAKGDSLSKIAQQVYGRADRWKLIFEANRDLISDPDLIHPGQVLVLPDESKLH
jgi:nucleoid-associated protein YgaU